MKNLGFEGYEIRNSVLKNNLEPQEAVSLKLKYDFHMKQSSDDPSRFQVECKVSIAAGEKKRKFSIDVTMDGNFVKIGEISDDEVRRLSFDAVFPYMRAYVANLTMNAGLPPLTLPFIDGSELPKESSSEEDK